MTEDGRNDYIVGREDGSIQVYVKRDEDSKPFENFRSSVQETIQTLAAGFISSPENKEIIINTFEMQKYSLHSMTRFYLNIFFLIQEILIL